MILEQEFEKRAREKMLQNYHNVVGKDSRRARNFIKKLKYKEDAYLLQCIAQTYYDESLYNPDGSQREFFESFKLRLAERYAIQAYTINENCIDVLWTLGLVRKAYRQYDLAIYCFKQIIELGSRKIAKKDTCTTRSLVAVKANDSRFQLYRLYHDIGNVQLSRRYLQVFKEKLKTGIDTLYHPLDKFLLDQSSPRKF